jgi:hypothetical protein
MPKPLPPIVPAPPADDNLVRILALAAGCSENVTRGWLEGRIAPPQELRQRLAAELWRPLGGWK